MALDGLHLPRQAPWRHALEAELLTFPAGKHDDQVDALGLVGQLLDRMVPGTALKDKTRKPRDGYGRWFERDDACDVDSWKVV